MSDQLTPDQVAHREVERIERDGYLTTPPGYDALRRGLLESIRVNVGLVRENTDLKRRLREYEGAE